MAKRSKRTYSGPPAEVRQMLARYVATSDVTRNRPLVDEAGLTAVWTYARAAGAAQPAPARPRRPRRASRPVTTLSSV
jgi:hypothetical protein